MGWLGVKLLLWCEGLEPVTWILKGLKVVKRCSITCSVKEDMAITPKRGEE
jgi:hypothetical protein